MKTRRSKDNKENLVNTLFNDLEDNMKTKKHNPKMWLMCGQHVNASDDKCTDLKAHCFTKAEYQAIQEKQNKPAAHTPTPWKLDEDNLSSGIFTTLVPEDAAYIVRAVNAHEELLQALKDAVEQFHLEAKRHKELEEWAEVQNWLEAAEPYEKAIAKAEHK